MHQKHGMDRPLVSPRPPFTGRSPSFLLIFVPPEICACLFMFRVFFRCLIPLVVSDYQPRYLAVNLPVCCILLLAKSPLMHRVRILDINATTGIDDRVKKE